VHAGLPLKENGRRGKWKTPKRAFHGEGQGNGWTLDVQKHHRRTHKKRETVGLLGCSVGGEGTAPAARWTLDRA